MKPESQTWSQDIQFDPLGKAEDDPFEPPKFSDDRLQFSDKTLSEMYLNKRKPQPKRRVFLW